MVSLRARFDDDGRFGSNCSRFLRIASLVDLLGPMPILPMLHC